MSYFAKSYFIPYDHWFDENKEKSNPKFKNQKNKNYYSIHDFFYTQSTNRIGASENNLELSIEKKFTGNLSIITSEYSQRNSFLPIKQKYKFNKSRSLIKYKFNVLSISFIPYFILGVLLIFGLSIFINNQSSEEKSYPLNKLSEIRKDL